MYHKNSELTIKDLQITISSLSPVKVYLNDDLAWEDTDFSELYKYYAILQKKDIVTDIRFEIVDFHHSIVYITTI